MKIMNILTLRYLKANKKRSLLTLLCIMVSVIMMICVGMAFSSGKAFYKSYIEKTVGDYHYYLYGAEKEVIDLIANDPLVDEYYKSDIFNLSYQDANINVLSGDYAYFQKRNLQDYVLKGRLPVNKYEILVTEGFLKQNQIEKNIGDQIKFDNGNIYTIVGLMSIYKTQDYFLNTYQALTYIDENQPIILYVKDKDTSNHIFDHTEQLENQIKKIRNTDADGVGLVYNSSYLAIQDIFEENSKSSFLNIYKMIYILIGVIGIISIFIIYQAFHLSTNDRIQYLGMLSSVGATPTQKKRSVYFEGFILTLIAIPLGLIITYVGLSITFLVANQMDLLKNTGVEIHIQISIAYMIAVIVLSFLTVAVALYIPARRISRISIMDALHKNDEVKVKKSKLQLNSFLKKYLHISWQMALKNYKRQGRKSKIIIFSLVLSMCLFITVFSFSKMFLRTVNDNSGISDYNIKAYVPLDNVDQINQILDSQDHQSYHFISQNFVKVHINQDYLNYQDEMTDMSIAVIDQKSYEDICKDNNIVPTKNKALIYDTPISIMNDNGEEETYSKLYKKMDKNFIEEIYFEEYDGENIYQRQLENFDSIELLHTEDELGISYSDEITLLVPIEYYKENIREDAAITYYIQSDDADSLCDELASVGIETVNIEENSQYARQLVQLVQIFVYGFVSIMVFFTLLNILNMMSASIEKRRKEFAMILSVGMSYKDMTKMIFIESFIYGIKTVIYGFPLCLLIEYIMYQVSPYGNIDFSPSWIAYIISFLIIFLVMILTFKVGLNRFRKQNIIETLKDDM